MDTAHKCQFCDSAKLIEGRLLLAGGFSEGLSIHFPYRPKRLFSRPLSVDMPPTFHACAQCGNFWSNLSRTQLARIASSQTESVGIDPSTDCPTCQFNGVVKGSVFHPEAISSNAIFLPLAVSVPGLRFDLALAVHSKINICIACGLVWSQISGTELSGLVARHARA